MRRATAMRALVGGAHVSLALACSLPQSPVCERMIDCFDATDVGDVSDGSVDEAFGPEGTCWRDRESAAACERICRENADDNREAFYDVDACCADAGPGLYGG